MFKRMTLGVFMAAALIAAFPAQASHPQTQGMVFVGGAPRSFCGAFPPPGHNIHKQDPEIGSRCFGIPAGAVGAHVTYKAVHAQSFLGCEFYGDEIEVWGGSAGAFVFPTPTVVLPTVAQSFTVTWRHDTPTCTVARI